MSNQRTCTHFGFALIMFAVVAGLIFVIHTVMQGVVGSSAGAADMSEAAVAARIAPVAQLNTGAPIVAAAAPDAGAAPAAAARSGEEIYKSTCSACHGTGAAGAPIFGDKAAWAPRIKQGMDTLVKNAVNGIRAMPPRGTCGSCSDADLKKTVEYMVSKSK